MAIYNIFATAGGFDDWQAVMDFGANPTGATAELAIFENTDGTFTHWIGTGFDPENDLGTVTGFAHYSSVGVLLGEITGVSLSLADLIDIADGFGLRDALGDGWMDQLDPEATPSSTTPASPPFTQIVVDNLDGTQTRLNGTGLTLDAAGDPAGGTVASVEHFDPAGLCWKDLR